MKTFANNQRGLWGLDSPTGLVIGVVVFFLVASIFTLFVLPAIGKQGGSIPRETDSGEGRVIPLDKTALAPGPGSWNY